MEATSVTKFREYVRINTSQPTPDYASCVDFLTKYGEELGLEVRVIECIAGLPIVIMTLKGRNSSSPAILLNSHTDVVPVFLAHWTHDPFKAHKDDKGNIYGRGTQDMKSVGIQYLEAIRKLKDQGKTFRRTIHLTFVPEEEVGGLKGMGTFVKTKTFEDLNIGFALDEGYASQDDSFHIFYGERAAKSVWINCGGPPGHSSQFLENTACEKFQRVLSRALEYRSEQKKLLDENSSLALGDVVTTNVVMTKGGVQFNVIPAELSLGLNFRIPPTMTTEMLEKMVEKWCEEAGENVTFEHVKGHYDPTMQATASDISDANPWWKVFIEGTKKAGIKLKKPAVFPAGTDSKYLRRAGVSAFGFSPMCNTPLLLHDHNEFLNEEMFLKGIEIYCNIIPALADCE